MHNAATSSMRALFLSSLAILLLWFLTYPSAAYKLDLYSKLRTLHTWLDLQGLQEYVEVVFESKPDERIDHHIVELDSSEGYYAEEAITVETLWPKVEKVAIELVPADHYQKHDKNITDKVRIYQIVSLSSSTFPANEYFAVFLKGLSAVKIISIHDNVFRNNSSLGLRQIIQSAHESHKKPYWEQIRPHLVKFSDYTGEQKPGAQMAALAKLRAEVDPETPEGGVQVFGFQLSIKLFFSSVGILLAAVSFAMIGPLMGMKSSESRRIENPWIFLLPFRKTVVGGILEILIVLISLCWALSPLIILNLQRSIEGQLGDISGLVLLFGRLGLIFASVVQCIAAYQLGRLRWSSA